MKVEKIVRFYFMLFVIFFCVQSIAAQENILNFFINGGISSPNMKDINNIYHKDLVGYKDVNYAFDMSSGFSMNVTSQASIKFGFNFLFHFQNPPVKLIKSDGDTIEGSINYQIKGYNPFLGLSYNDAFNSTYHYGLGVNFVYCIARLSDDLEEADTFFDYLKGNGIGSVIESHISRSIGHKVELGLELGYRLLNIKKLKIDSQKYEDESEDIEFTLDGKTVDLDFSGPFLRLLFVYKL